MQWLDIWLFMLATNAWVALLLGLLGLVLVLLGIIPWLRRRREKGKRGGSVIITLVGLVAVSSVASAIWQHTPFFLELFRTDYTDETRLADLQKAALDRPAAAEATTPSTLGEWPQWRGPLRDGISTETGLNLAWSEKPPAIVWKQPLGRGDSSVSVAHGRLYTMDRQGDQERVLCLDAATGKTVWSHAYAADFGRIAPIPGKEQLTPGPRATPTVHDGRVYTVGGVGRFLCLEATGATKEAKVLWEHDLATEFELFGAARFRQWGMACSPLIEGDFVIVQPGGQAGSIVAFDRKTGERRWQALDDESGYSSPVAATAAGQRQIIALTGKRVVGLRPSDGGLLWSYGFETKMFANIATPIVAGDYVFVSANYEMGCALLQLTGDGMDGVTAAPVYFKANKLLRNHHASCVLHDGCLYGFDNDFLKCVDLRTGTDKWHAGRAMDKGCLIYADGYLLVQTQNGLLVLIEATPAAFRKKGQIQVLEEAGDAWALPSLADGRLYLRDGTQIVCLDLRE